MPQRMLKKMLYALSGSGAVFCRPEPDVVSSTRGREPELPENSGHLFDENIRGSGYFHAAPETADSYYPPERHPAHVEIVMPFAGTAEFLINHTWQVLEDRVYVLLRNTLHTERCLDNEPYTLFWLSCLPESLTLHRTGFSPENGYSQSACRIAVMPPVARALWECSTSAEPDEPHFFSLLVQAVDFAVQTEPVPPSSRDYHLTLLQQIRLFLQEHFAEPVSLAELARMVHCSPQHLNRLFTRHMHCTLHQYLLDLRLEEAKRLLKQGTLPGQAARLAGFPDQRYFSRFFRERTGMTPSGFADKQEIELHKENIL